MEPKIIHVASHNAAYRNSLKATVASFGIGDVIVASPQGQDGMMAVLETEPDILVVSTAVGDDTVAHLRAYRDAAPQAHIVGFAFTQDEEWGLRDAGVETVVSSKIDRAEMIEILLGLDRKTST